MIFSKFLIIKAGFGTVSECLSAWFSVLHNTYRTGRTHDDEKREFDQLIDDGDLNVSILYLVPHLVYDVMVKRQNHAYCCYEYINQY